MALGSVNRTSYFKPSTDVWCMRAPYEGGGKGQKNLYLIGRRGDVVAESPNRSNRQPCTSGLDLSSNLLAQRLWGLRSPTCSVDATFSSAG